MRTRFTVSFTFLVVAASPVGAHPTGHDGDVEPLHVGDAHDDCYFDLHPELTQSEFDRFAKEGSVLVHDQQLSGAETLGRGTVHVILDYAHTAIDDAEGAWNNTMSHPEPDHYLGHALAFPRLGVRMGVADGVDVGLWGTLNPNSNYGFVGLESKFAVVRQHESTPVSVAVRPTAAALLGPDELFLADAGVDVSVSHYYKGLSPYVGFNAHTAIAIERSDEVELDNGTASYMAAFGGLSYRWSHLQVAGQAETGPLTTYSLRVSGTF